jgi:hypothetical protein
MRPALQKLSWAKPQLLAALIESLEILSPRHRWILLFNNVRFTLEIPGITALDPNSRGLLPLMKTQRKFLFLSNTKIDEF